MKKRELKSFFLNQSPVFLSFVVVFLITSALGAVALFGFDSVVLGGDSTLQILPFMAEFRRKVLSGENLFYSWAGSGGFDFWAVYCYYLSSPFTWLCLLVKESDLSLFINFLVILKLSLCGAGFSYYATKKNLCASHAQTVLFSVLYALCGYTAAYCNYIIWLDVVALFPLLMLGMEKIVYEKKPALYTLTLAVIFMCNYYLAFTVAVGVIFYYFTFRFENLRDFVAKSLRMIGFSTLSAASCSAFLIPSFLVANEAGRGDKLFTWGFLGDFAKSIKNLLFFDSPDTVSNVASTANIYVTLFALYFAFLWFFACEESRREKIRQGIILGFLLLSFNLGALNMIWHGFRMPILVQNRFSFMFCFALIVLAAKAFAKKDRLDKSKAVAGSIVFCIFVLLLAFLDTENMARPLLSLAAAAAYCLVFFRLRKPKLQFAIYALCATIGIITCFVLGAFQGTAILTEDINDPALAQAVAEVQTDDALYREKNLCIPQGGTSSNKQTQYGLRGFPTFSSYINSNHTTQYLRFGLIDFTWNTESVINFQGENLGNYSSTNSFNSVVETLTGVRYIYSYTEQAPVSQALQTVYEQDGVTVSENLYALPVGYMLSDETISKISNANLMPYAIYNSIASGFGESLYTVCSPSLKTDLLNTVEKNALGVYTISTPDGSDPEVSFTFKITKDDTLLTLFFGGLQKTDITVFCNGNEIWQKKAVQSDFPELGTFRAGDIVKVSLTCKEQLNFSIALLRSEPQTLANLYEKMSKCALQITEADCNTIAGTVTAEKEQSLFTTIPYSKYWTVLVDGEKTQPTSLNKGFLVIPLTEGTHNIELQYTAPAFWVCLCISIFGLLLSFVTFFIYDKKTKSSKSRKDDLI